MPVLAGPLSRIVPNENLVNEIPASLNNEERYERPSKLHALDGDMNVYQDVSYDDVSL